VFQKTSNETAGLLKLDICLSEISEKTLEIELPSGYVFKPDFIENMLNNDLDSYHFRWNLGDDHTRFLIIFIAGEISNKTECIHFVSYRSSRVYINSPTSGTGIIGYVSVYRQYDLKDTKYFDVL